MEKEAGDFLFGDVKNTKFEILNNAINFFSHELCFIAKCLQLLLEAIISILAGDELEKLSKACLLGQNSVIVRAKILVGNGTFVWTARLALIFLYTYGHFMLDPKCRQQIL